MALDFLQVFPSSEALECLRQDRKKEKSDNVEVRGTLTSTGSQNLVLEQIKLSAV